MFQHYRAKPKVIQAFRFDPTIIEQQSVVQMVGTCNFEPVWQLRGTDFVSARPRVGDYVIKNGNGFEVCRADDFENTYEKVYKYGVCVQNALETFVIDTGV